MYLALSNSQASLVVIRFKETMKNKISPSSSSAAENPFSPLLVIECTCEHFEHTNLSL